MSHAFVDIAFTPSVKAAQQRDGSRAGFARNFESGWPYVQHRGGPRGFLKVLDAKTLGFADSAGNRQWVSVGNAAANDRVALILVDYANRVRLKVLGRLALTDLQPQDALAGKLLEPGYRARPQRAMLITFEGFDWNCPQHIPVRIDAEDVQRALDERDARIAALEARLAAGVRPPPA